MAPRTEKRVSVQSKRRLPPGSELDPAQALGIFPDDQTLWPRNNGPPLTATSPISLLRQILLWRRRSIPAKRLDSRLSTYLPRKASFCTYWPRCRERATSLNWVRWADTAPSGSRELCRLRVI